MSLRVILISVAVLAAIGVVGGLFWLKTAPLPDANNTNQEPAAELPTQAWIEVVKPGVSEISDIKNPKELKTGDELLAGDTIETDKEGSAAIHFPDGSVARLDPETKLTLDESQFNHQSEKLIVKMTLAIGKVWSKILELATPDSLWEVKTSNAVATVRGTSFGVDFLNGRSRIMVAENKVKTAAIDPKTKEIIPGVETVVSANQMSAIKDEDIPQIKVNLEIKAVEIKEAPADVKAWVEQNQKEDIKFEQKIEEIKKSGAEEKALREEFRKEIYKEFETQIKAEQTEEIKPIESQPIKQEIPVVPPKEGVKIESQTEIPSTQNKIEGGGGVLPGGVKERGLEVGADRDLSRVTEGDKIKFSATFIMKDGTKKDVTTVAKWTVIGPIGKMITPGIFEAMLSPEFSEMGRAPGSIAATWKDPISGQELTGSTPIFYVEAYVPGTLEQNG